MDDKMKGGYAVRRIIWTSLVLAVFFLFASGVNATPTTDIQQRINAADYGEIITVDPGTYEGTIDVNRTIILLGLDNPVLTNSAPGDEIINISSPDAIVAGFTITGFVTPGSSTEAGIHIDNQLDMTNTLSVYNNIIRNGIGLDNTLLAADCFDCSVDASPNFWGPNGADSHRGEPGADPGDANNRIRSTVVNVQVDSNPWLTATVSHASVLSFIQQDVTEPTLINANAGVDVALTCTGSDSDCSGTPWILGSALYNDSPARVYAPNLPGDAVKFVNVFVKGCTEGTATVTIYDYDATGVVESTLTPYVLRGTVWTPATSIIRNAGSVQGTFPVELLDGSPIALVGNSYQFSISPEADPSEAILANPVLTISIDSSANIGKVYYQLDHHGSTGWKLIEDNSFADGEWINDWNLTDQDWANVTNGNHAFYFKFERQGRSSIGVNGELNWQFYKGSSPPPSLVQVINPNARSKLSRTPSQIKWTLPSTENIESIELWFARDGDFNMNGGLNNPIHIASLGGGTTYVWRSPNIQTSTAKILVVVTYTDGTEYYGLSDNFSIVKGYSFRAYKPAPKPVYQIGSGISHGIAILGSWFKVPRAPIQLG